MTPDVAVVMGTWDRRAALQRCVASLRAAMGGFTHRILVADAGSTDGSREWLTDQPDCELLEGGRAGAVPAFNVGFARAVDLGAPWVVQFNDDLVFSTGGGEVARAIDLMVADAAIGAVAFASDRYTPGQPNCAWMRYHNLCYCNQGVFRRAAGMAAARFIGDPDGRRWWDPAHRTYASDTVLGLALWRLGWRIHEAADLCVHDSFMEDGGHEDPLRKKNYDEYTTGDIFLERWGDPASAEYNDADARRFGGRIR
jgi:glycosyltransferase involved in cell wall biosynthesis